MMTFAFPEWLNTDLLAVAGVTVAASVALVGLVGLRKIPRRARVLAVGIRIVVLLCAVGMLVQVGFSTEVTGARGVVIIDETTPEAVANSSRERAATVSARVLNVTANGVHERGVRVAPTVGEALLGIASRVGTGVEERPLFVDAWLKAEDVARIVPVLGSLGMPHSVKALYPEPGRVVEEERPKERETPTVPSVRLSGAPVVLAHEPSTFGLTLRALPTGVTVLLELDGKPLGFAAVGLDEFESATVALEPGEHRLEAMATHQGQVIAECVRTVFAVAGEEIVVLSRRRALVDAWHALMPRFRVVGLDPAGAVEAEYLAKARAVVLPLDEVPVPSKALVARLEAYVADGGMVFASGLTEESARKSMVDGEVLGMLPVRLIAPPPMPPPVAPPKPDEPPKDPPKEQPKPTPPTVKQETGEAEVAKVSVVFVIDHSTSMSTGGRWAHAVAAVKSALENIQSYDRIGVILFGDEAEWAIGGGIVDVEPGMSASIREHLDNPANGPKAASTTDIYAAVDKALGALATETSSVRLVVVISDGDEGPKRVVDTDHLALASKAMGQQTMIATIRVGTEGPVDFMRRADKVMAALATREDLKAAVSDAEGAIKIPSLSLVFVQLAYKRHGEIAAEKQREKDERDADARKKAEKEARSKAEEERARIAALKEEERKREEERIAREEEERRRREEAAANETKRMLAGGFRQGVVELTASERALQMLGWPAELPPIGESLLAGELLADAVLLAQTASEEKRGVGLAATRRGLGHVIWFRAPMNAQHAGSWLSNSDHSGGLLDGLVRRFGRPRLGELSSLSEFEVDAGRATAVVSGGSEGLGFVAVTYEGREVPLATERTGERLLAVVPPMTRLVELREADGAVLARSSAIRVVVRQESASPSAFVPVTASGNVEYVQAERLTRKHRDRAWMLGLLTLALVLMPVERWLRRV